MVGRVIIGEFQGVQRVRVSRDGYDVEDPGLTSKQLAFDSAWIETCNVWMTGSVTLEFAAGARISFGRDLGYIPIVLVWLTIYKNNRWQESFYPELQTDAVAFSGVMSILSGFNVSTTELVIANASQVKWPNIGSPSGPTEFGYMVLLTPFVQ